MDKLEITNPYCFHGLHDQLQALALPADTQLSLYPDGSAKVDELALDFDQWWSCVKGNDGEQLTEAQHAALNTINDVLAMMSGQSNAELWAEDALRQSPEWVRIRELAHAALAEFGWPITVPEGFEQSYNENAAWHEIKAFIAKRMERGASLEERT